MSWEEKAFAYDTETTGLKPFGTNQYMFGFCTGQANGNIGVYRIDGPATRVKKNTKHLHSIIERALDGEIELVFHNAKFDLAFTEKLVGFQFADKIKFHDTMVMSHILQNDSSHRLKDLAWELAGIPVDDERAIKKYTRSGGTYQDVPEYLMHKYMERDALRTILLHLFFYPKIRADRKFMELYRMELNLIRASLHMERRGLMLNRNRAEKMVFRLSTEAGEALEELRLATGRDDLKLTDAHISWLLYKYLKLKPFKWTKKGKNPSTDKEVLAKFHEEADSHIIDLVMKHRAYKTGASTLSGYLDVASKKDIIHPTINTLAAVTSRESISDPSLQNVRKSTSGGEFAIPMRSVFRPRPGYILVLNDFRGIELRLLVEYSQEEELVEIMKQGGDVHEPACRVFFESEYDDASPEDKSILRGYTKNCNFGLPYGASDEKAVKILSVLPPKVALKRIHNWRKRFPRLGSLGKDIQREVIKYGFVTTRFGRRLRVPRSKAYMGTNYLIQGTGADIVKRAQVRVDKFCRVDYRGEAHVLIPIHDEIILEYPRRLMPTFLHFMNSVKALMEDFPIFSVPIEIEASIATASWNAKREYHFGS
jgi:DNA polymerase I-like protein with 3'-5' exonuclease and polymerase domains